MNGVDFKRPGDTFVTHDLKRCYAVQAHDPVAGSTTFYQSDYRGQPMGTLPFVRKFEPQKVWTFIDGPSTTAIRARIRKERAARTEGGT